MDLAKPAYLGDGLYAEFDGYQVELYASNGISRTNRVFLEPGVLASFLGYVSELRKAIAEHQPCVSSEL